MTKCCENCGNNKCRESILIAWNKWWNTHNINDPNLPINEYGQYVDYDGNILGNRIKCKDWEPEKYYEEAKQ